MYSPNISFNFLQSATYLKNKFKIKFCQVKKLDVKLKNIYIYILVQINKYDWAHHTYTLVTYDFETKVKYCNLT